MHSDMDHPKQVLGMNGADDEDMEEDEDQVHQLVDQENNVANQQYNNGDAHQQYEKECEVQESRPDHEGYKHVGYQNHIDAEQPEEEVDEECDYLREDDQMQDDQPIYDEQVAMDQEEEEAQIDDEED